MFCVGDLVCYPIHGVGVIEAIQEQQVLGETAHYYAAFHDGENDCHGAGEKCGSGWPA